MRNLLNLLNKNKKTDIHFDISARASELMACSDALQAKGKWPDAIELLSVANGEDSDIAIERRLIDLRMEAFGSIDWPKISDPWPPTYEDMFSDVQGVPEISPHELNVKTLGAGIQNNGSMIVRGLLSQSQVSMLVECIDSSLIARMDHKNNNPNNQDFSPWYHRSPFVKGETVQYARKNQQQKFGRTGSMWVVDSPRSVFRILEMYKQLGLNALLSEYFGETSVLSRKKWVLRRAKPRAHVPQGLGEGWHQDGQFLGEGIRTVNMWIALSSCGDDTDAPGIEFVPKRLNEILETGTKGADMNWTVGSGLIAEISQDSPVARPHFEPGDALFFDSFLVHRTAHAQGLTHDRHALESWFFAASRCQSNEMLIL